MYTEENLRSAISAGILTEDTVSAFKLHVKQIEVFPQRDEERVRLVTGLNDIFVVIACVLLLLSVGGIGASIKPWLGAIGVSVIAWCLSEFFTRKRQMAFPSIVLMLAFVGGLAFTAGLSINDFFDDWSTEKKLPLILIVTAASAAAGSYLHWLRFKVPMVVAVGALMLLGLIYTLILSLFPGWDKWLNAVFLSVGVFLFIYAMFWDTSDRKRQTYKSDIAFWLHLFAAPLIVHPIFATIGIFKGEITLLQSAIVIGLYIFIALISLLIDRRALMISALIYVLYAFTALLKQYDFINLNFAITALVIGLALLLLAAFWHKCRNFALQLIPSTLRNYLAPTRSI